MNTQDNIITINDNRTETRLDKVIKQLNLETSYDTDKLYEYLNGLEFTKLSEVLYPDIVLAAYHVFYKHKKCVLSENRIDQLLFQTITAMDIDEYINIFKQNISAITQKIIALRCSAASTGEYKNDKDRIDKNYKTLFCKKAGIPITSTLNRILDNLEIISRHATTEDVLLGRIGYLMAWKYTKDHEQKQFVTKLLT